MTANEFVLRTNREIPYYSCRALESLPWLRHGFSTRQGGAAASPTSPAIGASLNLQPLPWDTPERVAANRQRLLSALRLPDAPLISLRQTHSARVLVVDRASDFSDPPEGDALLTNRENIALAVRTADCFPVLLADPEHRAVGAVHSGWRGTLAAILPGAIAEMRRCFHSDPARLLVAMGPAIRACCFEVGEDVARFFLDACPGAAPARQIPDRPGKYLVDLAAVLQTQLARAGVPPEHRYDIGYCTACGTREFFSWRAEGQTAGRMMAVIAVVPERS